ncbi:MAG: carboxypeptidase-like regulatory domain-containing protein, partial [Flavobacterium sp.]
KGEIRDLETNKPIPYVNIWVENESIGTTSEIDGSFTLAIKEEKKLVFSAMGYETQTISSKNNIIKLKPIVYELEEVVVSNLKNTRKLKIGNAEKSRARHLSGNKPWIYGKLFEYDTIYKKTPYLKEIIFYTHSEIKDAKIKLRIFHFKDSLPTHDMIDEDLVVTVKKGNRKNVLDVSKYKINFPKTGIVIGIEWLIIEENKYQFTYFDPKKNTKISNDNYAPDLVINYSKTENSFHYRGKWYKQKKFKTKVNDHEDNVLTPAINLVLTN